MHHHKAGPRNRSRKEHEETEFVDPFNPWDDPLGLGPLETRHESGDEHSRDSDDPEQNAEQQTRPPMPSPGHDEEAARLKTEMEELRLRSAAEMENFKKRLQREHDEQMRYASERVLSDILPSLDNLDLALRYGSKNEACNDLLQGVAMTRKLLLDAVAGHGLTPFGKAGDAFTPERYEAVGVEKQAGLEAGTVSRVLQAGYLLGEKVLRPAKVMIHQ
ncbi:MAG: nucleotide exchange factor GrpE [Desulfovibrio sp.]|jgi:molecular chaperone GrpE|nr:nucleotide exchange factor GrpE [Desulfovibrio sp.]